MQYKVSRPDKIFSGNVVLPASKSISNRVLIIQHLCEKQFKISNLSNAKDTQTLQNILAEHPSIADVGHAGTAMRFLSAYFLMKDTETVLTGSVRMQNRPIGILVDVLKQLGGDVAYVGKENFPPLKIKGGNVTGGTVKIDAGISSQFISALLLVAPCLRDGLTVQLIGIPVSAPYIQMTLDIMVTFGIAYTWKENVIAVASQKYKPVNYTVEADWSAASYFYEMAALADQADIFLEGLTEKSLQGDIVIASIMESLGVTSEFTDQGVRIIKNNLPLPKKIKIDFSSCPDLAQTVLTTCAGLGVEINAGGLQTLHIKETDRILALQKELKKLQVSFTKISDREYCLQGEVKPASVTIDTYDDHRMAMAFAPLAIKCKNISIADPQVVKKSFPDYWKALKKLDFSINEG